MNNNKRYLALDDFIYNALYNLKNGFYMKKNPFGEEGDFITSPNISILFSEMLAIWTVAFWENLKCPKKINLVELGSGNGQMIHDMINTLKNFPDFFNSCNFYILEKSPHLKKIQKQKLKNFNVKWINNLSKINNEHNIFIANEFFDALPIKQFFKIEKKLKFKISKNQDVIEYSPLGVEYIEKIAKKINVKKGGLLIIDYGYTGEKMKDTLKAVRKHNVTNVLDQIGNTDITYNLNFSVIKKIIKNLKLKCQGITTQRNFLINLGIEKRAEIISKNLPFSKKADIYYRLNRLINKKQMGDLFKVMLITNNKTNYKIGF